MQSGGTRWNPKMYSNSFYSSIDNTNVHIQFLHLCFFLLSAAGIALAVALAMSSVQGIVLVGFLNGDCVSLGQRDELSAGECVEAVGGRCVG